MCILSSFFVLFQCVLQLMIFMLNDSLIIFDTHRNEMLAFMKSFQICLCCMSVGHVKSYKTIF